MNRRLFLLALPALSVGPLAAAPAPRPPARLSTFTLADQFGTEHHHAFPRARPLLLLVGDRQGSEQVDDWIPVLKKHWGGRADIAGIADVRGAPRFLRERITDAIRRKRPKPVMLDFEGKVVAVLDLVARRANVFVIGLDGTVVAKIAGEVDDARVVGIRDALEPLLSSVSAPDRPAN